MNRIVINTDVLLEETAADPGRLIARADRVLSLVLPVAHNKRTCLQVLAEELQRPETPDAIELAVALVALQRLAHRFVTATEQNNE